jgi:uncharacterized membrane protein (UPF0136 family)
VNKGATLFILLGLFLAGGVYSFWKQKMSKSIVAVMAMGAVMALAAGLLRL